MHFFSIFKALFSSSVKTSVAQEEPLGDLTGLSPEQFLEISDKLVSKIQQGTKVVQRMTELELPSSPNDLIVAINKSRQTVDELKHTLNPIFAAAREQHEVDHKKDFSVAIKTLGAATRIHTAAHDFYVAYEELLNKEINAIKQCRS